MPVSRRVIASAVGLVLGLATVTGCTSTSYKCTNETCSVTLNGSGSDTELYDDAVTITLNGADGSTAELDVDGEQLSCEEGDTVTAEQVDVTCTSVGDDEVELDVVLR